MSLLLNRLAPAGANLVGVLVITFLLTRALPGDPAAYLAGPAATQQVVEQIRADLGLDAPLATQLADYLGRVVRGDLGQSWVTGQPVWTELLQRFPASLELTALALLLALGVALPAGIAGALRAGSLLDHTLRVATTLGVALPIFFTGLSLVYVFYYLLGWFPAPMGRLPVFISPPQAVTGALLIDSLLAGDGEAFRQAALHIALPALTLASFAMAPLARMTRAAMLGAVGSDFVRTARAANLPWRVVVLRYALQNALLPVLTTLGMVFSFLLGANVLVEKVFSWPGIGSFALEAVMSSDYAAVQGFVLCMGVCYVLLNLCVDLSYALIDPRVRVAS